VRFKVSVLSGVAGEGLTTTKTFELHWRHEGLGPESDMVRMFQTEQKLGKPQAGAGLICCGAARQGTLL
jgi:hypothetical protein